MSSNGEIIPANKPFTFEGLDIRPSFRASETGAHTYSVNMMVTEEMWNSLKTIPRHHIIGGILYWTTGDEPPPQVAQPKEKPKKAAKPKGEWGPYWTEMFKRGFDNHPDLREILDQLNFLPLDSKGTVKDALHEVFAVNSLTFVPPESLEKWAQDNRLDSLIAMSRQAAAKLQEAHARAS